jgi:hypothetical protein
MLIVQFVKAMDIFRIQTVNAATKCGGFGFIKRRGRLLHRSWKRVLRDRIILLHPWPFQDRFISVAPYESFVCFETTHFTIYLSVWFERQGLHEDTEGSPNHCRSGESGRHSATHISEAIQYRASIAISSLKFNFLFQPSLKSSKKYLT